VLRTEAHINFKFGVILPPCARNWQPIFREKGQCSKLQWQSEFSKHGHIITERSWQWCWQQFLTVWLGDFSNIAIQQISCLGFPKLGFPRRVVIAMLKTKWYNANTRENCVSWWQFWCRSSGTVVSLSLYHLTSIRWTTESQWKTNATELISNVTIQTVS